MAAIKHDVRVRMFLAQMWQDVTEFVYQRTPITITRGRRDETTKTTPSTCKLTLKNHDGRFTAQNPMGPYYGEIGRNNPIVVSKRLALDTFGRSVVDSWGNSDRYDGVPSQRWAINATLANFDVTPAGGTVVVAAGQIEAVHMPDVQQADVSLVVEFSSAITDVLGNSIIIGPAVRVTSIANTYVYARILITTGETFQLGLQHQDGTVYASPVTVPGLTYSAGTHYSARITADGETVAAKLWATASGEPQNYFVTASGVPKIRGSVGLRTAVFSDNLNAPITIRYHRFEVESIRFAGEVPKFSNASDPSGRDRYVPIEATGVLRRLGQGRAPVLSTLRRGIAALNPVAYWPCEEGPDATQLSSAVDTMGPFLLSDAPTLPAFAANSDFASSQPIPTMNGCRWWSGALPLYDASAERAQVRFLISVPRNGVPNADRIIRVYAYGSLAFLEVKINPAGHLGVDTYDRAGAPISIGGFADFQMNGRAVRISVAFEQLGADLRWTVSLVDPAGTGSGGLVDATMVGRNFVRLTGLEMGSVDVDNLADVAIGHVTVQNVVTNIFEILTQLQAYNGERALTRMNRLALENSLDFVAVGAVAPTMPMGVQRPRQLLELMRECADSDMGSLYEARGLPALGYRTRTSVYGQTPDITLDVAKGEVGTPFQIVEDDQQTRNDVTATRVFGGEHRVQQLTGPMSVLDPPDGIGRYDDTPEFNVQLDAQLPDIAYWAVTLGTQPEGRLPNLSVDMEAPQVLAAGLGPAMLDLDVDDLVVLINARSAWVFDDIRQIMRGYTESLGNHRHTFRLNVSPAAPYDVEALDSGVQRIRSGTSSLTSALTATTMSFSVTTTDPGDLWTTDAAQFPLDIMIGGERIRLSTITGASSPQTFTVAANGRAANGVTKGHAAGAVVDVADPWRLGL